MKNNHWETRIGLEVHVQLLLKSKLFSGAAADYNAAPNTQACAIDLAFPGVLPVLNEKAVRMAVLFGLSIEAQINYYSHFDRKNYFYPDLSKAYQITQFEESTVGRGLLEVVLENGDTIFVGIDRAHLEEDAGKSIHQGLGHNSGIDFNRAGTALLEIVSDPVLRSAKEAVAYLKTLHQLVRYLKICDGNLQEGSFRCDANVSVRRVGSTQLGIRSEIKNLNSFRYLEKAIDYEVARHISLLELGQTVVQETRLYDAEKNETRSMRSKEDAYDYRYFPDPDLCPVVLSDAFIDEIRARLPELPKQKYIRFQNEYGLSAYDARLLVSDRDLADYFESVVAQNIPAKLAANWINGELASALNKMNIDIIETPLSAQRLADLLKRIVDHTISGTIAKMIFELLLESTDSVDTIIQARGLQQITDTQQIETLIDTILAHYPQQLADYRAGKEKLLGFFIGQIMKASGGKFNPTQVNHCLIAKLKG